MRLANAIPSRPLRLLLAASLTAMISVACACAGADQGASPSAEERGVGKSYRVPYKVTFTNHYLVRVRVNGKGPFNFLVDTGAPALYLATETAKKIGVAPSTENFFTPLERLDFEGGAFLLKPRCRVEDPFQLVGMNALGLPGASIDGILGFSALARFRITMDPTQDRMTWTRLDHEPKLPDVPKDVNKQAPAEVQAMSMLGPAMKVLSAFTGKAPETKRVGRGYLGVEIADGLKVAAVWPDSPALKADLKPGDRIQSIRGRTVKTIAEARDAVAQVQPGDRVAIQAQRGSETLKLELVAEEGL